MGALFISRKALKQAHSNLSQQPANNWCKILTVLAVVIFLPLGYLNHKARKTKSHLILLRLSHHSNNNRLASVQTALKPRWLNFSSYCNTSSNYSFSKQMLFPFNSHLCNHKRRAYNTSSRANSFNRSSRASQVATTSHLQASAAIWL